MYIMKSEFTAVEQSFSLRKGVDCFTNLPYIVVDNFPDLGKLAALRFLEWVGENPNGVISLPTGKTPEYFIGWVKKILAEWDSVEIERLRKECALSLIKKPALNGLHFVQIDEFYPISPKQHNSFYNYVQKYYVEGFGLDFSKGLFINSENIPLAENKHFTEVFSDGVIDLSLRYREPKNAAEELRQRSIFMIDDWCSAYEERIREKGGIGFFLGGIGPDGHIAFNVKGSDFHSTTRLTYTNFKTQAAAASDLGGIEISRHKPVITIGLDTITYNQDATAIIFAAGEAKARVVADALEGHPSNQYPASALTRLKNSRFYLTNGAASALKKSVESYYLLNEWNQEKSERAVIDCLNRINKYGDKTTLGDLQNDTYCKMIPDLSENTIKEVAESIKKKIEKGTMVWKNEIFYHTGPHHDDIMLGLLPHIHRVSRDETNKSHFSIMTSGFNAVTNDFLIRMLEKTLKFIADGRIGMLKYADFFDKGYALKREKDIYHYLISVAAKKAEERERAFAHRIIRNFIEIWGVANAAELINKIEEIIEITKNSYDGERMNEEIRLLKGMIREFEEELVWGFFGIESEDVHHLRLGFYTGDIFTEQPSRERDVEPILCQLRKIRPTIISVAFDPEGSGPDTHYKVLQAIADAIRQWGKETDISRLKIWGYRNVWYKFHPSEATHIVPVSLNAMSVFSNAFENCYLSQVDASFPSPEFDGKFSDLAKKLWVEQFGVVVKLLGKPFFYQNESPRLRTTHGLLFFKEMTVDEFLHSASELGKTIGGK